MRLARIALVLLGAGKSERFGSDKLQYPVDGVPMLRRAVSLYADEPLADVFSARVLVTQRHREEAAREAGRLGYTVIYNDVPERGISYSIRLGAEEAQKSGSDGILFSVADQPYLTAKTVLRIAERFTAAPDRIVAPFAGERRGNPVLFPIALTDELCALSGDVGGSRVIRAHAELLVRVEADAEELRDLDRRTEELP